MGVVGVVEWLEVMSELQAASLVLVVLCSLLRSLSAWLRYLVWWVNLVPAQTVETFVWKCSMTDVWER